jgi:hypothetical protein
MTTRSLAGLFAVLAAALAPLLAPSPCSGDIPKPPDRRQVFHSSLTIRADPALRTAEIRLSRNAAEAIARGATSAAMPERPGSAWAPTPVQTAAVGISLSAALVTAGLWVQRRRKRLDGRALGPFVAGFLLLAATTVAVANMPPPSKYQGDLRKALPMNGQPLTGPIDVVVDDSLDSSELVVPTNDDGKQ